MSPPHNDAQARMPFQRLHSSEDPSKRTLSSLGVVTCNVAVDVSEPDLSFVSPIYFNHVLMRASISSLEIVRPSSESLSPRSIIRWNASSRMISSYELSSGCCWTSWVICSLAVAIVSYVVYRNINRYEHRSFSKSGTPAQAHGGVGHSESWRAGAEVGVWS